jgi:endoribonuclease Dicer
LPEPAAKAAIRAAVFTDWINKMGDKLQKRVKGPNGKVEDDYSMQSLLSQQEAIKITDPREYQIELFERAKVQNTIAVLPTGSGKTLIAVLLLRYILDQEVERRATGNSPKFAFFLVTATTLVCQQFAVLNCNLDHKVEKLYGSMDASLWEKASWTKILDDETMVIVCTAEILYHCLFHAYIKMEEINLLIFDEAHHTKQNAPYAKIIRDFYYTREDKSSRPRIFGMTASPVDTKNTDLAQAALALERLMDCKIATVELANEFVSHAEEAVCYYDRGRLPFETSLWRTLNDKFGHLRSVDRLFRMAKELTSIVGPWGADYYWTFAFADEAARKMEARAERVREGDIVRAEQLDERIAALKDAGQHVLNHHFKAIPDLEYQDLSPKVVALHGILMTHFDSKTSGRCIVFVQTRAAAQLLFHIFRTLDEEHLKVGVITGAGGSQLGDESQSFRKQVKTLLAFRKGEINCLFGTSVAEEGLDIPSCNLVIRFDLYNSMIGYVQSRGRARQRNSKFYHMVEKNNRVQEETVMEARRAAAQMKNWCSSLPPERVLKGTDEDLPADWTDRLIDPETGATLTSHVALSVLANYVSTVLVPADIDTLTAFKPQYVITGIPNAWQCEVILPPHCPGERIMGEVKSRRALAKRSAAFAMCKKLHKARYLDKNFLLNEKMRKAGPLMRNARIGIRTKNLTAYGCRLKPTMWTEGSGSVPTEVYMTVIDVDGSLGRPHQPLAILSREPLPNFPSFPVFLLNGDSTNVLVHSDSTPIPCVNSLLQKATNFTLTLLLDLFKKDYEESVAAMPYWVVPILPSSDLQSTRYQIDIACLDHVIASKGEIWTPEMPLENMEDRFMVDKYSARRVFSIKVDPTKTPQDPVPSGPRMRRADNILDNSNCLWKKSREGTAHIRNNEQPVIEAVQVSFWQDMLARPQEKFIEEKLRTWICPEFFKISTIPTKIAAIGLIFPAVIHRLEDYMISMEAAEMIGLKLDSSLALEAMTKNTDNCLGDDGEEQINFRGGMGPNYERLEFLGDCFLKMATSISLFSEKPNENEFEFHVERMLMLCNKNLLIQAQDMKLYEYVRSQAFSRRTWYPPCINLLKGKGINLQEGVHQQTHDLGDKTVADVCESLIGAAFYQYNQPGEWNGKHWDAAVKTVTRFVKNQDHSMVTWKDYVDAYQKPDYQTSQARARDIDLAKKLSLEHDYEFKYPRLATSAFKHPSEPASEDKIPSYQRLEFLGDSLLDLACVSSLYYRYPDKDPQWLTEHKMAIVSNKFLGALCVKIGFHRHLRPWHDVILSQISDWVIEIEEAERVAGEGEVNYWTTVSTPPKCLSDVVESYIGAIFVDSGFNFGVVQKFFDTHFMPFFQDMRIYDTFANNHPTTKLQTLLSVELGCRDFKLMGQEVPQDIPGGKPKVVAGLMLHDKIVAFEVRESGGYAKVAASKSALSLLEGLFRVDFRRIYGCDCKETGAEEAVDVAEAVENIGTAI